MKKRLLIAMLLLFVSQLHSQESFVNNFDDTSMINLEVFIDSTDTNNVWQIGKPQKTIFDTSYSAPNVLVTDTINPYFPNDTSSFVIKLDQFQEFGILACTWMQKLDMDYKRDFGVVEFRFDTNEWQNVAQNPFTYNFYGFLDSNFTSLNDTSAQYTGFTGQDTNWRHIWLCWDYSYLHQFNSLEVRFTFYSDSIEENRDGWMIDNMDFFKTFIHTVAEEESLKYFNIHPNPSKDYLNIHLKKSDEFHIIERLSIVNMQGQRMDYFEQVPVKFFVDISSYPKGTYFIDIQSNKQKIERVQFIKN